MPDHPVQRRQPFVFTHHRRQHHHVNIHRIHPAVMTNDIFVFIRPREANVDVETVEDRRHHACPVCGVVASVSLGRPCGRVLAGSVGLVGTVRFASGVARWCP